MLTKRVYVVVAAALLSLLAVPLLGAAELPNVVAVVNGQEITKEELVTTLIEWDAIFVLDDIIQCRLVEQEAKKEGVVVTAEEVNARLDEMRKQLAPGRPYEAWLKDQGLTPGRAFAFLKMQMESEAVAKKLVKITPEVLDGYRKASQLLIRIATVADPKEKEKKEQEAKAKVEQVAQEIKNGLAFEEAVLKYSEEASSKRKRGDMGFFSRENVPPELANAAFALKPGEISEPVRTVFGYHLIKLEMTGNDATGDEKKKLEETIVNRLMFEKRRDWLLSIKNKAEIKNALEPEKPVEAAPAPDATEEPDEVAPVPDDVPPPPSPPGEFNPAN